MSDKPALDHIKELSPQLSQDERVEVLKFISDLPGSNITYLENKPPTRVPLSVDCRKNRWSMPMD